MEFCLLGDLRAVKSLDMFKNKLKAYFLWYLSKIYIFMKHYLCLLIFYGTNILPLSYPVHKSDTYFTNFIHEIATYYFH